MEQFYFVYILQSEVDGKNYAGYTKDLKSRLQAHQKGEVVSTKYRRPLKLIYYEACLSQEDALKREKYFKTHYGKMYLKNRLKSFFRVNAAGRGTTILTTVVSRIAISPVESGRSRNAIALFHRVGNNTNNRNNNNGFRLAREYVPTVGARVCAVKAARSVLTA